MASAPDTTSIPGYTIFREGDYDSVAATAMLPQGVPHPLGTDLRFFFFSSESAR
jgi:primary-amine oxidase